MGGNNFDMATIYKLITSFDSDRSGQVGLNEFVAMHRYLVTMRDSFRYFDRDNSGTLDSNELLQTLQRSGYRLTQYSLFACMPKFDKERKGSVTYAQYLELTIFLGNLHKGSISLTLNIPELYILILINLLHVLLILLKYINMVK